MTITLDWVLTLFACIFMFVAAFAGFGPVRADGQAVITGRINWMCLSFAFLIITLLTP